MGEHPDNEPVWTVEGVVLAGGASRRMGRDKSLIPVGGVPMAVRVVAALQDGGCRSVRVIGGDTAALIALGLAAEPDAYPGEGPLGAIAAALASTSASAVLVAACDLAYLTPNTVRRLSAAAAGQPASVVSAFSTRREPLCAIWPRSAVSIVGEAFASGARAVAAAFDRLDVVEVPVDTADLRNLNQPSDLPELPTDHGIA